MKKYTLTETTKEYFGITLYQIKALRDIDDHGVEEGDLGGWIADEKNLDQNGNAWVYGNARVYGDAWVSGDAQVYGNAWVSGNARVYGDARVYGNARVYGDARVYGNARVYGDAWVSGDAQVYGNAWVYGNARVYGDAQVYGNAWVYGNARVYGDAWVSGDAQVYGNAWVSGNARVETRKNIWWSSVVGSECGTLTAYTVKTGEIEVTRGCFRGTIDEFEAKVKSRHGESRHAEEYLVLIQYIRLRFRDVTVTYEVTNDESE